MDVGTEYAIILGCMTIQEKVGGNVKKRVNSVVEKIEEKVRAIS